MSNLEFVMEPSYQCPDDETGDVAFLKATRVTGDQNIVGDFMACELFPLSMSFNLGEISEGETPVSKLTVALPKFPITRCLDETIDGFRARVEIAEANIVGRYTCRENMVCDETLPNGGRVNKIFEHAGVPYEPHLEPGSEACEEAAKKRKNDACAGPSTKCVKVYGQKEMPTKASMAPKSTGATPLKMVPAKAPHGTQMSKGTSVPSKVAAPPKSTDVLRISTGAKRPVAALPPRVKGKQVKISVRPSPASTTPHDALVQQPVVVKDGVARVSYCTIRYSVLSAESHSSSSNSSAGSESIMASPPPTPDVHISMELPYMTQALEAEVVIDTGVHTMSLKGWFLLFLRILHIVICFGDFDFLVRRCS
jgi:hypothetical protein